MRGNSWVRFVSLMTAVLCMDGGMGETERRMSDFGFVHVVMSEENEKQKVVELTKKKRWSVY